jgi:DNA-binding NarL/FixJ family response regulator
MESLPAQDALAGTTSSPRAETAGGPVPAVLFGGDDDRRLLLKGILLLHRHPVSLEARSVEDLRELAPSSRPELLVFDAGDGPWADTLATSLRERPTLRAVVLLPPRSPEMEEAAIHAGARSTVTRPFTIRELVDAIDDALAAVPGAPAS